MSYLNEFIFEGEKAVRTKYYGYYATESGKVISIKIKGGQGKINYSKAREMVYKENKDGYYEVCLSNIENDFKGIYNCKELEKNFSIKRHEIYSF